MISAADSFAELSDNFRRQEVGHHRLLEDLQLPKVDINVEKINPITLPKNSAVMAFVPNESASLSKKLLVTWKIHGLGKVLELLSHADVGGAHLAKVARTILRASLLFRQVLPSCPDPVAAFSRTRDWTTSSVRCLAWHPHTSKLAVATKEDSVLVFSNSLTAPVIIRHSSQKDISSLSWRPFSSSQLAVSCARGVAVWSVDPLSLGSRPSASCLIFLPHTSSVNTLAWHPQGNYLCSGSVGDSRLHIWNVESREQVTINKYRGCGYTQLWFSPSGDRLLAATPTSTFRLFETNNWTCEDWTVVQGHVQAASWSPTGGAILFADSAQPALYCLAIEPTPILGGSQSRNATRPKAATVVVDLSDDNILGGLVQDIAWDPRGERLAVTFRASGCVALYRTRHSPSPVLLPCRVLKGHDDNELPSVIQFKPEFQAGALLSVAWSSGRVQHVPFTFVAQDSQ